MCGYLLRIQQYPVNNTYNSANLFIATKFNWMDLHECELHIFWSSTKQNIKVNICKHENLAVASKAE